MTLCKHPLLSLEKYGRRRKQKERHPKNQKQNQRATLPNPCLRNPRSQPNCPRGEPTMLQLPPFPKPRALKDPAAHKNLQPIPHPLPAVLMTLSKRPPELKQLPRGATRSKQAATDGKKPSSLREGMLSMAQKAMLEEERERVVKAYRELKKTRATG